jgi:general secretion pathway protein B
MSILLEALKKSEAQRQLGKAPTLDSPSAGAGPAGGSDRIWIPAVMISVAVAVIGWIGSAQYEKPESLANNPVTAPVSGSQESNAESLVEKVKSPSERSARTPVMDFAAPDTSIRAEADAMERPAAESGTEVKSVARVTRRTASRSQKPAVTATTEDVSAAAPGNALMPEKSENNLEGGRQKPADRIEPNVADSISYWRVPQSVRDELPELHISVLVYAENPEDRFVLLNGQRLREKDEHESGIVLDEIQRDRAIFNYRNYRFYLRN